MCFRKIPQQMRNHLIGITHSNIAVIVTVRVTVKVIVTLKATVRATE